MTGSLRPGPFLSAFTAFALAACATGQTPPATPRTAGEELISFEPMSGPYCDRCQSAKFTASSSGRVWIESGRWADSPVGDRRDRHWYVIRRVVQVAPERFAAFRERLRPYRPVGRQMLDGFPVCERFEMHSGGVILRWQGGGDDGLLVFDFGCDPETRRAASDAVRSAPALLGIPNLHLPTD